MFLIGRGAYLALTLGGCFGAGSLYGWSGYLPSVRAVFEVNNASASMVFSLALLSFTLGVLLGPVLLARLPPRLRLPVMAGCATLSLGVAASSASFGVFSAFHGGCFGFTSGALYNLAVSTAATSDRPTLMVPVSVAAFGLGGAVFGPAHVWLAEAGFGLWSIAPAFGCLAVVTSLGFVSGPVSEVEVDQQNRGFQLIRPDKTLGVLWVIFAAGSCSGLIVLGFAAQFLPRASDGVGLAGLAVFLVALGNTFGRLSSALTAGRFGPARGIAGSLILSTAALALLVVAKAPAVVMGLLFLVAFAYGQLAATTPLLVRTQVVGSGFAGSFGWVFTGWGFAGLVGPWTAGWLLDATGTFRHALFFCMALAVLSLWLVLRLDRHQAADQG